MSHPPIPPPQGPTNLSRHSQVDLDADKSERNNPSSTKGPQQRQHNQDDGRRRGSPSLPAQGAGGSQVNYHYGLDRDKLQRQPQFAQQPQSPHTYGEHQSLAPIRLIPGQPPPFATPPFLEHFNNNPQHYLPHHPRQQHGQYEQYRQQQHQHQQHPQPQRRENHRGSYATPQSYTENQFPVQPLDRFKVKSAPFRQPIEIGSFSYDEKRNFIMDDSQLKYYFPPDLSKPNNLSVNYEKYISRDLNVDEHIDALLDALMCIRDREEKQTQSGGQESSARVNDAQNTTKADFVCYRGIITKIMCTPYTRNEPWELGATLFNGSIYIEEHVSQERRENAAGSNDRHKLMSYWGYRFETICNISKPVSELRRISTRKRRVVESTPSTREGLKASSSSHTKENPDNLADTKVVEEIDLQDPELIGRLEGIVDTNLQYCTVVRTKIGRNSIIMGAEVDCTSEPKKLPPHNPISNYIELKTSRVISNAREQNSFERHKLLKFWAQSFLPGIPTIIVGFRDDDGNVVTVQTFKTMELPRLVRGKEGAWDTTVCINFLNGVLDFLRKIITVDDPEVTYTIRWGYPFKAVEVEFAGKRSAFLTKRFLNRWNSSC